MPFRPWAQNLAATAASVLEEEFMKSSAQIKKISVRRTGDIRLTAAMCKLPYFLQA
jgi:hypothetical protein